jgi:hypothetical protein
MNVAPVPGATYFQLMSVEPGVAEVFAEGLHSEGFDAIAAAGASPAVHRVLVGPLTKDTESDIRARLEARGFRPFQRRYPETEAPASGSAPQAGSSAAKP